MALSLTICEAGRALSVDFGTGPVRFAARWLRHNCQDVETIATGGGQRGMDFGDLDRNLTVASVEAMEGELIWVTFSDAEKPRPLGVDLLRDVARDRSKSASVGILRDEVRPLLTVFKADYQDIQSSPHSHSELLEVFAAEGAVMVTGAPAAEGAIVQSADLFGYLRPTNYGQYFNVRVQQDPANLADSPLGLPAHTDNPYRDPTPGVQILQGIENETGDPKDGVTYLVDGYLAAEDFAAKEPEAFKLLCEESLPWRYISVDAHLVNHHPVFEFDPAGKLKVVRFNNRSFGVVDRPDGRVEEIYDALALFATYGKDPARQVAATLSAGDVLLMDNWRMLHGRTGFKGSAKRWLQGGYIDRDAFESKRGVVRRMLDLA